MPERRTLDRPDVEALLADLRQGLDWPVLPDAVAAARNRVDAGERARRQPRRGWWMAWVAAAAAALVAIVLILPGPRKAVADLFSVGGVQVRQLPTSAPVTTATILDLGQPTTLEAAASEVPFDVSAPAALGPPAVFTDSIRGRRVLSLVYGPGVGLPPTAGTGIGLLITEFAGSVEPFVNKVVVSSQARRFSIDGRPALWIEGPHTIFFDEGNDVVGSSEPRLAANTLVVTRGNTTVRLEGGFDEATAVRLAESLKVVG